MATPPPLYTAWCGMWPHTHKIRHMAGDLECTCKYHGLEVGDLELSLIRAGGSRFYQKMSCNFVFRGHWPKFRAKVLVKYRYTVLRLLTKDFSRPLVKIPCQICKCCVPWPLAKIPCQSLSKIQVYCHEASDEGFITCMGVCTHAHACCHTPMLVNQRI